MTNPLAALNDVNTTAIRILASVILAGIGIVLVLIGILFRGWDPTPTQMHVLAGIAGVVLTMMGFDVLQFASKRFSAREYVEAKAASKPQVVAGGPTQVHIDGVDPRVLVPDSGPFTAEAPVPDQDHKDQFIMPLIHRESEKGEGL